MSIKTGKPHLILFFGLLLIISFACQVYALDASISASVDKRVLQKNEQVTLTIVIKVSSGNPPQPQLPQLDDFKITGTYSSSYSGRTFINGRYERNISKTYTMTLLPLKAGKLTIPRIQINHKGQIYKTNPIQIEVIQSGQQNQRGKSQQSNQNHQGIDNTEDAFLLSRVDKNEVYVGEQLIFSFSLYHLASMSMRQPQLSKPLNFEGFKKTELEPTGERIRLNGRIYDLREWKFSLIPVLSGEYKIDEVVLNCQTGDFARSFFYRTQPRKFLLSSNPVKITVKHLPIGSKPADFSGAVGNYTISSFVDKNKVKENEAISLKLEIAGRGDLSSAKDPVIPELPEFSIYKSKSDINTSVSGDSLQTLKTYEFALVPEKAGNYTFPPIKFSYFDTLNEKYKTIKTESFKFIITPGKKIMSDDTLEQFASSRGKKSLKLLNQDIQFIKPDVVELKDKKLKILNPIFLLVNVFPLFLLIGGVLYKNRETKLKNDIGYARSLKAEKLAKKKLKESQEFLEKDSENLLPFHINKAITEFIADKLNISAKGLTIDQIEERLKDMAFEAEEVEPIVELLNDCDLFRYSSTSSTKEEREKIFNNTRELMISLERKFEEIKRNSKK